MDLIKIPHFNPQELKILEREIKAMTVFDNERASKNSRENFHRVYGIYMKIFLTLLCSASKYGIINLNVLIDAKVCGVCVCLIWIKDIKHKK